MGKRTSTLSEQFFKHKKPKLNDAVGKTLIIELYTFFDEPSQDLENYTTELACNTEIGVKLRNKYNQSEHFIYALDDKMVKDIKRTLEVAHKSTDIDNLINETSLQKFETLMPDIETLLIVAQLV